MSSKEPDRDKSMNPHARKEGLIVEDLSDETLVYDQERHKAHCLNQTAAFVWRHCDGQTSVSELARLVQDELGIPTNDDVVWLALDRLHRTHLLQERQQEGTETRRYSRRLLVKRLGQVGIAVPMVASIVSPAAAQAASCLTRAECRALTPPFCSGQPICNRNRCCRPNNRNTRCRPRPCL